jgi:hypothetical protein
VGVFLNQAVNALLNLANVEKIVSVGITALAEAIVAVTKLIITLHFRNVLKITFLKCNLK